MDQFMKEAIKEAKQGIHNNEGGPFGAVIIKDGKIIGRGHNQVIKNQDATCHGEIMAIHDASKHLGTFDLSGCTIYTTGYPCPMCMGAIHWANIVKINYGCTVEDTDKIGFRDKTFYETMNSLDQNIKVVDRQECLELYDEYSQIKEKEHY